MNWLSYLWRCWNWLTRPKPVWPRPPYVDDNNMRGLGWSGDRGEVRPFNTNVKDKPL